MQNYLVPEDKNKQNGAKPRQKNDNSTATSNSTRAVNGKKEKPTTFKDVHNSTPKAPPPAVDWEKKAEQRKEAIRTRSLKLQQEAEARKAQQVEADQKEEKESIINETKQDAMPSVRAEQEGVPNTTNQEDSPTTHDEQQSGEGDSGDRNKQEAQEAVRDDEEKQQFQLDYEEPTLGEGVIDMDEEGSEDLSEPDMSLHLGDDEESEEFESATPEEEADDFSSTASDTTSAREARARFKASLPPEYQEAKARLEKAQKRNTGDGVSTTGDSGDEPAMQNDDPSAPPHDNSDMQTETKPKGEAPLEGCEETADPPVMADPGTEPLPSDTVEAPKRKREDENAMSLDDSPVGGAPVSNEVVPPAMDAAATSGATQQQKPNHLPPCAAASSLRASRYGQAAGVLSQTAAAAKARATEAMDAMNPEFLPGETAFDLPDDVSDSSTELPSGEAGNKGYVDVMFTETYEQDAGSFAHDAIGGLMSSFFTHIPGLKMHPVGKVKKLPVETMEHFPPNMMGLSDYVIQKNQWWIDQFEKRRQLSISGVAVEPPRPRKKKANTTRYDDEEKRKWEGPQTYNIRMCFTATVPLQPAINKMQWVTAELGCKVQWAMEQSERTICFAKIANLNRGIELEGFGSTITTLFKKRRDKLKRDGTLPEQYHDLSVPTIIYAFRSQPGMEKSKGDNAELEKYSCNKVPWYKDNGCYFLELRCDAVYLHYMLRILKHFIKWDAPEILGHAAVLITFNNSGDFREVTLRQRQKHFHCDYVQHTRIDQLQGTQDVMKQVKQEFADGRKPERKYITVLSELRSMRVWIPDPNPKKQGNMIRVPVIEGAYRNAKAADANTLTVVMRKDRPITAAILKKMQVCFFSWFHWYCIKVRGYTEEVSRSLQDGLGPGLYDRARYLSTFDVETLNVEVEFPEVNAAEDRIRAMEREYGMDMQEEDEAADESLTQKVVLEFEDPRIVSVLGAKTGGDTYAAGTRTVNSGTTSGASTVNKDNPQRDPELYKQRAVENSVLRGQMATTEAENARLQNQLDQSKEDQEVCQSMAALLAGGDTNNLDPEEMGRRFQQMASMFSRLKSKAPPGEVSQSPAAAPPALAAEQAATGAPGSFQGPLAPAARRSSTPPPTPAPTQAGPDPQQVRVRMAPGVKTPAAHGNVNVPGTAGDAAPRPAPVTPPPVPGAATGDVTPTVLSEEMARALNTDPHPTQKHVGTEV